MASFVIEPPSNASGLAWTDLEGRLLLIEPLEQKTAITTSLGEKDAISANIVVLDGPDAPCGHDDALVFPRVLQAQLKKALAAGSLVLGRLGKGTARPGQNAPWKLADPTDDDRRLAEKHLEKNDDGSKPPF